MSAFRVVDRARRSRPELSAWNSTSPQRSAAASARRGKPSRMTWFSSKSTRVRRSIVSAHSRQCLSLSCSLRTRAAARTAAKASAVSGAGQPAAWDAQIPAKAFHGGPDQRLLGGVRLAVQPVVGGDGGQVRTGGGQCPPQ